MNGLERYRLLAIVAGFGLWVLVLQSCAGATAGPRNPSAPAGTAELAWPADRPRVRLAGLLEPRPGTTERMVRRIAGEPPRVVLERAYGAAWDGDDLLLTDPGAGRVVRLDRRGRIAASWDGAALSPIGVAVCDAGIVVTDSRAGVVTLLDRELRQPRLLATDLLRPTGVACRGDEIFVAETGAHRIVVLGSDPPAGHQPRRTFGRRGKGAGELNFPTCLAIDGDSLWVGDTLNFRLQRFDTASGAARSSFGRLGDAAGDMPRIKGVAIDARGVLWVTDAHLDQVALYRRDGTFLIDLGRTGGGPGEFSFPAGVAAHADGRVAVVDSLNGRVQLFEPVGSAEVNEGAPADGVVPDTAGRVR